MDRSSRAFLAKLNNSFDPLLDLTDLTIQNSLQSAVQLLKIVGNTLLLTRTDLSCKPLAHVHNLSGRSSSATP